jgi:mono/diheme cytochrome c family protein
VLYTQSCAPCHGATSEGGEGGGATLKNLESIEALLPTLSYGRNNMPPFQSVLTPVQVRDVSSFVMEVLNGE